MAFQDLSGSVEPLHAGVYIAKTADLLKAAVAHIEDT